MSRLLLAQEPRHSAPRLIFDDRQKAMPILECRRVMFHSVLDEELFFAGLKEISAVKKFEGRGHSLFVTVTPKPSQKALRELLGLFRRFGIDMHQLAQFETPTES